MKINHESPLHVHSQVGLSLSLFVIEHSSTVLMREIIEDIQLLNFSSTFANNLGAPPDLPVLHAYTCSMLTEETDHPLWPCTTAALKLIREVQCDLDRKLVHKPLAESPNCKGYPIQM